MTSYSANRGIRTSTQVNASFAQFKTNLVGRFPNALAVDGIFYQFCQNCVRSPQGIVESTHLYVIRDLKALYGVRFLPPRPVVLMGVSAACDVTASTVDLRNGLLSNPFQGHPADFARWLYSLYVEQHLPNCRASSDPPKSYSECLFEGMDDAGVLDKVRRKASVCDRISEVLRAPDYPVSHVDIDLMIINMAQNRVAGIVEEYRPSGDAKCIDYTRGMAAYVGCDTIEMKTFPNATDMLIHPPLPETLDSVRVHDYGTDAFHLNQAPRSHSELFDGWGVRHLN